MKQAEGGNPVSELCREHGISGATVYKWRSKYGGMDVSMMTRMKEVEAQNSRLKKMYAEERLKADILSPRALEHQIENIKLKTDSDSRSELIDKMINYFIS